MSIDGDEMRPQPTRAYQPDQLYTGRILGVGFTLLASVVVILLCIALWLKLVIPRRALVDAATQWTFVQAGAGVHPNQAYDRMRLEAAAQRRLNSYGWLDSQHLAAHIPIDRAIEQMTAKKLQMKWPESEPPKAGEADE